MPRWYRPCLCTPLTDQGFGVYFFFATFMLISIPYVYFLLPETRGIPLEDVHELFRKDLKPWKAHPIVLAEIKQRTLERESDNHDSNERKVAGDLTENESV